MSVPSRGNSKCKIPEAGVFLGCGKSQGGQHGSSRVTEGEAVGEGGHENHIGSVVAVVTLSSL